MGLRFIPSLLLYRNSIIRPTNNSFSQFSFAISTFLIAVTILIRSFLTSIDIWIKHQVSTCCTIIFMWFLMRSGDWVYGWGSLFMLFRWPVWLYSVCDLRVLPDRHIPNAVHFYFINFQFTFSTDNAYMKVCVFVFVDIIWIHFDYTSKLGYNTRFISQFKINYFAYMLHLLRVQQLRALYGNWGCASNVSQILWCFQFSLGFYNFFVSW